MVAAAPRIVASIEARYSASRLPGKVLADIGGRPALGHLVSRLRRVARLDAIVLATTTNPADDTLVDWAQSEDLAVHRGSENDVLARVLDAQRSQDSDLVVEVCGDTPFLDPDVLATAIDVWLANTCDVVSNTWNLSFPQGIDAQVFRTDDLADVAATVDDAAVREHVSLYFYEHPERYRILHLMAPPRWCRPETRLQLDYAEDLEMLRAVHAALAPACGDRFGIEEIVALLRDRPDIAAINRDCVEKPAR